MFAELRGKRSLRYVFNELMGTEEGRAEGKEG